MSNSNKKLIKAKVKKGDEFYTELSDIENELKYYRDYFKGKTIFCNCDDPTYSNFWKYFQLNFYYFGLKKLVSTHYEEKDSSYKLEIVSKSRGKQIGIPDYIKTPLQENGDFRSAECKQILKECDIVVTNPPFSLFREFLSLVTEFNKDFIIIGNTNALTYKETFTLFKNNKIRTGYTHFNTGMYFTVPDDSVKYHKIEDGKKKVRVSTSCWFTSLPVDKHNEPLILYKEYTPEKYPKYENYDAINVNTYLDIPNNYDGIMGVPITFLDKYTPSQFELIGLGISNLGLEIGVKPYKEEHRKYRKEVQRRGAADGDLYMIQDGKVKVPYARILIRRKK